MKKTIVVIALLLLIITGCGKNKIVGKWKADGYSVDYYYIFNDDNTCAYEMTGAKMECTYETNENKVTILYKGNTIANTYEYIIEGDILLIKDSFGNNVKYIRN